ncbi:MAG: HNH nuclease family protein [Deltaproteobacteria bacterium]|nr:HNH nuclease family protein [Deltaproteobacteria bacterium]
MRGMKTTRGIPKSSAKIDDARRDRDQRMNTYRERALKMFPHICGRCGREFEGKRLRELTVHHKDHDHENNPPDGSNWELLCIYCHDMEHQLYLHEQYDEGPSEAEAQGSSSTRKPLASIGDLLKEKK